MQATVSETPAPGAAPGGAEAVRAVLARRLAFITGKGGVGKTTVSAALALAAADTGRRTLVCEVGAPSPLVRGLSPAVSSVTVDPDAAFREWLRRNLGRAAARILGNSETVDQLVAAAPGARELVTVGKAWDLTRADPDRLVIVDGPASGHAVALLQAPATFSALGRGGPIGAQAGAVRAFFADPAQSAIVLTCTPEELPVTETVSLAGALEATTGRRVDLVIADQVLPDRFDRAEIDAVMRALRCAHDPGLRAAGLVAHRSWSRARSQQEQLERLRASVSTTIVELPFLFVPALGACELRMLAGWLAAGRA
jgi:anion-transporting  ArsA/GET3 family ATPase